MHIDLNSLSPRALKNYKYKKGKKENDRNIKSRALVDWIDEFDLFAKPVVSFNMRGKERVTSRCGLAFSILLIVLVFYFMLLRAIQIMSYGRVVTRENIAESQAIRDNEVSNMITQLENMAFRAVQFQTDTVLDSELVEWQAFLVESKDGEVSEN